MDAEQYQKLFDTLDEINESLELTCLDIQSAVEYLKKRARKNSAIKIELVCRINATQYT